MRIRPKNSGFTVYLSYPMTGIELFNFPAARKAAEALRANGFDVWVPGENEIPTEDELAARTVSRKQRQAYLSKDIDIIQEVADAVVVLPGWEESEGCKLELAVAQAIGVPVFEFPHGAILRDPIRLEVNHANE